MSARCSEMDTQWTMEPESELAIRDLSIRGQVETRTTDLTNQSTGAKTLASTTATRACLPIAPGKRGEARRPADRADTRPPPPTERGDQRSHAAPHLAAAAAADGGRLATSSSTASEDANADNRAVATGQRAGHGAAIRVGQGPGRVQEEEQAWHSQQARGQADRRYELSLSPFHALHPPRGGREDVVCRWKTPHWREHY